ncbi:MAG TPA: hypothetical protein VGA37_03410 [Gemmatimonadales bacterium]
MKRLFAIPMFLFAVACGDTGGPNSLANVQVSFATQRPSGVVAQAVGLLVDTLFEGTDTLVLTKAEIVLREVELKRLDVADCDTAGDPCEKFEAGPVLVSLPLGAGAQQQFALDIPAGTYSEIEFDIHKPDDGDPDDQAFVAAHPAFADISIRVEGTYNGAPFVFTTDLNVEQELGLNPSLVITDGGGTTNVTILVDVGTWFRTGAGALVNPATANKDGANDGIVKENIKNSVEAYEDDDKDGGRD